MKSLLRNTNKPMSYYPWKSRMLADNLFDDSVFNSVFDKALDEFYSPIYAGKETEQTDEGTYHYLSVPGVKREEISIIIENEERLVVKREQKKNSKSRLFTSPFRETYNVYGTDVSKITAKLEDGVLTLFIPKATEKETKELNIPVQ